MEAPGNNITTRARGSSIWLNCTPSPLRTSATRGKISKSPIVSVREIRSPSSLTPKPKRKKPSRAVKRASSKTYAPARLQRAVHLRLAGPGREQMASTIAQCPVLTPEFRSIQDRHQALASTGCTAQFCQAGRMLHTDEPRVGENRALKVVEEDAKIFLQELHQEHFFGSDEAFCERLRTVLKEIRTGAVNAKIRQTQKQGKVGGNWTQTPAELEFGLRRAWRNSRKCIMRSHCEELKLCDLRSITSSAAMATELIKRISEAFNGGNIQPTVFAFPPRKPDSRGPMIWNHQVLAFAGYELDDGSILGDPASRELSKAIIELGWKPPTPRSKWDLLPIVTMAEDDVPVIAELPPDLRTLVQIRHPQYSSEFEKLDLKWVAFPALSRLGFDIGGVQYTAAPFIGWFMDAEIGVRNLADSFRYNVLPDIVAALGLADGKIGVIAESFEDLPEYERLSMLSRAQSELNYAVHWSYSQAKVNMTDSLTASMKWSRYDDEFREKNGFRLPADPYWLAPPQGSIIPLWHRGGAPNYQPKPMICKHVQDPLKVWTREKPDWFISAKELDIVANLRKARPKMSWRSSSFDSSYVKAHKRLKIGPPKFIDEEVPDVLTHDIQFEPHKTNRSIDIYFCSAGTLAEKIAAKLHDRTKALVAEIPGVEMAPTAQPLNNIQFSNITQETILLLVISSTGQGEIPANGNNFMNLCQDVVVKKRDNLRFRYAVYGNGDTRYSGSYNSAAKKVQQQLRRVGGIPIAGGLFQGDTANLVTAFQALSPWWTKLQPALQDAVDGPYKLTRTHSEEAVSKASFDSFDSSREEVVSQFTCHSEQLDGQFRSAALVSTSAKSQSDHPGSYLLTLDIGNYTYEDLACIQVLPINSPSKVRRALRALGVSASAIVELDLNLERCPSYSRFLSEFVDLEVPFAALKWIDNLELAHEDEKLDMESFSFQSVLEVLETLDDRGHLKKLINEPFQASTIPPSLRLDICLSMPVLQTRNYSIASSHQYLSQSRDLIRPTTSATPAATETGTQLSSTHLQILVKPQANGRFSSTFLNDCPVSSVLKYRIVDAVCGPSLRQPASAPQVVVATGAGFAPVRCLLQRRIVAARRGPVAPFPCGISLFLGLKAADMPLVTDLLMEAAGAGILDSLTVVPSNEDKVRVYDKLEDDGIKEVVRRKLVDEGGRVFVCAGPLAAKATKEVIGRVIGVDVDTGLGSRWVEEVF